MFARLLKVGVDLSVCRYSFGFLNMALQWFLLGVVAAVEAAVLLLLSAPLPREVSKQVVEFVKKILQPGLAVVPFALFQLLGIWHRPYLKL